MKKILSIVMAIVMIMFSTYSANAAGNEKQQLSALTDEECIAFLKEYNVEIPEILDDEISWAYFARTIIEKVEADPNVQFLYSYSVMSKFANDIKKAVIAYYSIENQSAFSLIYNKNNILQDNVLHGGWNDDYSEFNCYEYAINYITLEEEGWLDPGMISMGSDTESYYYNCYADIHTISSWVVDDLEAIGCTIISWSQTIPDVNISEHTNLICVRKDLDGIPWYIKDGILYYFHDYHFMKMLEDGNWYHKPGATNLLRYKYIPTNGTSWRVEGYDGNDELFFYDDEVTYNSNIWFIEYTTPHEWTYAYYGPGQHIMTCTVCGLEQLGNCEIGEPTYLGMNSHQSTCNLCNGVQPAQSCTLAYQYNGQVNGSNTHVHACTDCGHVDSGPTQCVYVGTKPCMQCGSLKDQVSINESEEDVSQG